MPSTPPTPAAMEEFRKQGEALNAAHAAQPGTSASLPTWSLEKQAANLAKGERARNAAKNPNATDVAITRFTTDAEIHKRASVLHYATGVPLHVFICLLTLERRVAALEHDGMRGPDFQTAVTYPKERRG